MNFDDTVLSHPHDFFRLKQLTVQPGTCFVLMPFADEFDLVYETIIEALRGLMICTRADDLRIGRPILERILRGIATSDLIIADLTDQNPNVFYELALAHTCTKNVLLLTQNIEDVPFDLRSYFCHVYKTNSNKGLEKLKLVVRNSGIDVTRRRLPMTLDTAMTRTQTIVDFMSSLLRDPGACNGLEIRIQASISSLGNTRLPNDGDPDSRRYGGLLEQERELLIRLVECGAVLRAMLSPNWISTDPNEATADWNRRIDQVISFLTRQDDCAKRCEFVVHPGMGPNLLFFGHEFLIEGHKTRVERGFGWTMVVSDPQLVKARAVIFDQLFESARDYTIGKYGAHSQKKRKSSQLTAAVVKALKEAKHQRREV